VKICKEFRSFIWNSLKFGHSGSSRMLHRHGDFIPLNIQVGIVTDSCHRRLSLERSGSFGGGSRKVQHTGPITFFTELRSEWMKLESWCGPSVSENQIITNHHYCAHFSQFFCTTKNRAYRHSWNTQQWRLNGFLLGTRCVIIIGNYHDYFKLCHVTLTYNDLRNNNNHNYTMTCRVHVTNHN
jgi:hypothetical protein